MKKKHPVLRNLLLDAAAAGLALTVFALFHHVLPSRQQSLNVQTVRPAAAQAAAAEMTETGTAAETRTVFRTGLSGGSGRSGIRYTAASVTIRSMGTSRRERGRQGERCSSKAARTNTAFTHSGRNRS